MSQHTNCFTGCLGISGGELGHPVAEGDGGCFGYHTRLQHDISPRNCYHARYDDGYLFWLSELSDGARETSCLHRVDCQQSGCGHSPGQVFRHLIHICVTRAHECDIHRFFFPSKGTIFRPQSVLATVSICSTSCWLDSFLSSYTQALLTLLSLLASRLSEHRPHTLLTAEADSSIVSHRCTQFPVSTVC